MSYSPGGHKEFDETKYSLYSHSLTNIYCLLYASYYTEKLVIYKWRVKSPRHSFLKIFLIWTIFKVLNLLQYCFCFIFCFLFFFDHKACGILAPQPGIEPTLPALKDEVSTTGLPRKSNHISIKCFLFKLPFLFKSPIQIPAPEKQRGKQVAVQCSSSAQVSHTAPVVAAAFFTVLHTKCTFNSFLSPPRPDPTHEESAVLYLR